MAQKAQTALNLPEYLKRNRGQLLKVKTVCIVDRQIPMPKHLIDIDRSKENIPVLVDFIGIELSNGERYFVKGKAVAILGPTSLEPTKAGKRILLLESSMVLVPGPTQTYVALTTIFPNRYTQTPFLYATKTLAREGNDIKPGYPEFVSVAMQAYKNDWDMNKGFEGINFGANYVEACQGVDFPRIGETEKFVFKAKDDWKADKNNEEVSSATSKVIPQDFDMQPAQKAYTSNFDIAKDSSTKKKLECRNEEVAIPELFDDLKESVKIAQRHVENKIEELISYNGTYDLESAIEYAKNKISKHWKKSEGRGCATGRALFKEVLDRALPDYAGKRIDSALDDLTNDVVEIWGTGQYIGNDKLYEEIIANRGLIYFQIIDYMLVLKGKLCDAYTYGTKLDIDMYSVMVSNPYYLTLVDNRLGVEELDRLAMLYNVDRDKAEAKAFRNAAYLHNLLLDTSHDIIKENTIINRRVLESIFSNGYILNKKAYEHLQNIGIILDGTVVKDLKCYVNADLESKHFALPRDGWQPVKVKGAEKYARAIPGENKKQAIQDYIDSGLGLVQNYDKTEYIMDYNYAMKEKYIVERMYQLLENGYRPEVDKDEVERCIRGFEKQKSLEYNIPEFKLEERQADAVRILHNPVMCLTGPAGSGKTTTAEALVYALQALIGVNEDEIMFCAPTGKAANRLKEVVKKPTRTIHSLFLVGGESYTLMNEKNVKKKDDIKVLIVDESSMIDLNLMYNMVSKIADGTRVIFLGDREQLPPIGPGKPFANLLTFLPCVVLNVTKRAAANSGITRNAKLIIEESEGKITPLEQADDFRIIPAKQDGIVKLVQGICLYHLGKAGAGSVTPRAVKNLGTDLKPDDIQVISPVNKHNWGTKNLNRELQDIFNPRRGMAIKVGKDFEWIVNEDGRKEKKVSYTEFRIGDRVIHLSNNNKAIRLIKDGQSFRKVLDSTGIMNGDVGKIENFYLATQLDFIEEEDSTELADTYSGTATTLYMAVEYTDVDALGSVLNYTILYRTEKVDTDGKSADRITEVTSFDLDNLDLAYALTVHKLQGSQAKLIIVLMLPVGRGGDFISRNMLYTALTRAKSAAYLVGDVEGEYSCITKGRRVEQVSNRLTITDKVYS